MSSIKHHHLIIYRLIIIDHQKIHQPLTTSDRSVNQLSSVIHNHHPRAQSMNIINHHHPQSPTNYHGDNHPSSIIIINHRSTIEHLSHQKSRGSTYETPSWADEGHFDQRCWGLRALCWSARSARRQPWNQRVPPATIFGSETIAAPNARWRAAPVQAALRSTTTAWPLGG